MLKITIFCLSLSALSGSILSAQRMEIEGSVCIIGNLDIELLFDATTTSIGLGASSNSIGSNSNTYLGYHSGRFNNLVVHNTVIGAAAGRDNTGSFNCFLGTQSGYLNTTGGNSSFLGYNAGAESNGQINTIIGENAGFRSSSGNRNLYIGSGAGHGKITASPSGSANIALGIESSYQTVTGNNNIAIGYRSLYLNENGSENIALGYEALYFNYDGRNVAVGVQALYHSLTGTQNTALGGFAGFDHNNSYSTFLGYGAGSTTSFTNATALGFDAKVNANNKVRIGDGQVTTIEGNVAFSPMSDRRLKENIQPVPIGLDFILDLNPVVYHRTGNEQQGQEMGLIAQELDSVLSQHHCENITMVNRGGDGYMSVRYNDLFAPLIRAIQEQQEMIEEQQQKTDKQESLIRILLEANDSEGHNSVSKIEPTPKR